MKIKLGVLLCFVSFFLLLSNRVLGHPYGGDLNFNPDDPYGQKIRPIWITNPPPKPIPQNKTTLDLVYDTHGVYRTELLMARPQQKIKLLLSTHSGYTAIRSVRCTECDKKLNSSYDGDASKTVKRWNETTNWVTQDTFVGEYSGYLVRDKVTLGDMYMYMDFVSAEEISPEGRKARDYDGVLSLHYGKKKDNSFFDDTMHIKQIKKKVIGFIFNPQQETKVDEIAGKMFIGQTHRSSLKEPMAYSYISSQYWVLAFQSFKLGNSEFCGDAPCLAYISFDIQFVLVQEAYFNIIMKTVNGTKYANGLIKVNCDDFFILPPIRFTVGGDQLKLQGEEYKHEETAEECFTIFQLDQNAKEREFTLGTYFLRNYYTEFGLYKLADAEARGVGIAKRHYG